MLYPLLPGGYMFCAIIVFIVLPVPFVGFSPRISLHTFN